MSPVLKTILLLVISNTFMLTAWYLHLNVKWLDGKSFILASILSWGIAFFEYQFHIPANRIGNTIFSLAQLQIIQVGMSLLIFIPFSVFVMKTPLKWDYFVASLLIVLAAYLIFRNPIGEVING